ncbi:GNAT family N-acetyltransferase [Pedobacter endophyticus]|uniref:GNAT family N-acetyltransferase n=1 Tax=Pedobacter endophyticus TaxID=2789740 RepID=A0A7S9Q1D3_9SPHI|nr:GNAT family N-acetyltransferase [Pedobacter endophyticus]QPH41647.1 GNAT family N-acetyltransferase [Pedobacter endophyticus]
MIETEKLILRPLTHNQLAKYINDDNSLEEEFGLLRSMKHISPSLQNALKKSILPGVLSNDHDYFYHTLWAIIAKPDRKIVGDICFVGEPDSNGEIEIGYTTYEEFRGRGFMTEAVGRLLDWAREQPEVKSVFASTEKENTASYAILQKNNFIYLGDVDGMMTWKIELK